MLTPPRTVPLSEFDSPWSRPALFPFGRKHLQECEAVKQCRVSFRDVEGIEHAVEVDASTLYGAGGSSKSIAKVRWFLAGLRRQTRLEDLLQVGATLQEALSLPPLGRGEPALAPTYGGTHPRPVPAMRSDPEGKKECPRPLASVYELLPRTCLEAASDGCPAGQRLYSLNPGFAVAIQIKEAEERLLRGVHFRESRLEAGPSW